MSTITTENKNIESQIAQTVAGIKDNTAAAEVTFDIFSKIDKGLQASVKARDFEFIADEPENLGGSNQGPNPVEYILGALAACQEITIKAHASQLDIDIESVEVQAEGDIDLHGFLGLSDERPGFKSITYQTEIETNEQDTAKLKRLEEISNSNCPVLDIIQNETPVSGETQFVV